MIPFGYIRVKKLLRIASSYSVRSYSYAYSYSYSYSYSHSFLLLLLLLLPLLPLPLPLLQRATLALAHAYRATAHLKLPLRLTNLHSSIHIQRRYPCHDSSGFHSANARVVIVIDHGIGQNRQVHDVATNASPHRHAWFRRS